MNNNTGNASHPKQLMVWWVIWCSFLFGIVQIYFFLGKTSIPSNAAFNFLGLIPFVASSLVRWVALPKLRQPQAALVAFILGIAIAEASCFLGLFIFPAHKQELFVLSLLGIAQFAPFFAKRFFA